MRHFGETPPWAGVYKAERRLLHWTHDEPLWDGTPVWRLVDQAEPSPWMSLLKCLPVSPEWLNDDFLPMMLAEAS